jgi:hypothetical protein
VQMHNVSVDVFFIGKVYEESRTPVVVDPLMSRSREILDNNSGSNNSNSVQLERVEKDGGGEAHNTDVHMSDIIKGR